MSHRSAFLVLAPVCALVAGALLWRPADAQPRIPPALINLPPTPFTYNKAIAQDFQTTCTVGEVQYWENTVKAFLQCNAGTSPAGGQTYPGGQATVILPDTNSVNIALAYFTTNRSTMWSAYHFAGDNEYRLKGIGN